MKVILVNPNHKSPLESKRTYPPLGLAYIAAVLKNANRDVEIIDAAALDIPHKELEMIIERKKPDVVGVTSTSIIFPFALEVCEIAKKYDAITVIGGIHPSVMPEETTSFDSIDIAVIGEGEVTMIELIDAIENKKDLRNVRGIIFKENGNLVRTPPRPLIKNLDSLPFPDRDMFPYQLYTSFTSMARRLPCMHIMSSRGCFYKCVYCASSAFWGTAARMRSPKNVVDEIEFLIKKYGIREIMIYDDMFNTNLERAEAICDEIIARKLNITWRSQARVHPITENLLKKMKKAGCWCIYFGVESGNQDILNSIKKGITLEWVNNTFALSKKVGIKTVAYFMIGLPNDTRETIYDTINFAKKLDPDFIVFNNTQVYPGTEIYYNLPLEEVNIQKGNSSVFTSSILKNRELSEDEMAALLRKTYVEFYIRPAYILKRVLSIKSLAEFKSNFVSALFSLKHRKNPFTNRFIQHESKQSE